jgi:NDP-mannose synthase
MKAVIMAGGRGQRLLPYTTVLPKPLMPIGDRPVIDVIMRQLVSAGVESITISVGHLGNLLESWVRAQHSYGVPISFLYEDEPLGTAGALEKLDTPDGPFLAMNGDILTTLDFLDLAREHSRHDAIATMAVRTRQVEIQYGVVHADEAGMVAELDEKPTLEYTVSMGVYAFQPKILQLIESGEPIDFPDLLLRAISRGHRVRVWHFDGYWRDIGNRDDYEAALTEFAEDPGMFSREPPPAE